MPNKDVYGYCPICMAPGEQRERRMNGNDRCTNGHFYPSAKALKTISSPEVDVPNPFMSKLFGE